MINTEIDARAEARRGKFIDTFVRTLTSELQKRIRSEFRRDRQDRNQVLNLGYEVFDQVVFNDQPRS